MLLRPLQWASLPQDWQCHEPATLIMAQVVMPRSLLSEREGACSSLR